MIYGMNSFLLTIPSIAEGTQPATNKGTLITSDAAVNTYGAYTELMSGATLTDDTWEVWIYIASASATAQARELLVTIGVDPAGGSSYTDTIQHLYGSCAGALFVGPVPFRFPLLIRAGSSIAAKCQSSVSLATCRMWLELKCRPTHPRLHRRGIFVRTFGATLASSSGTVVVPGTAALGAWAQLGAATAETLWWWEYGYGINDTTMTTTLIYADLGIGDATNKHIALPRQAISTSASESITKSISGVAWEAGAGSLIYGRAQSGATPDDNNSMIAYGVGG